MLSIYDSAGIDLVANPPAAITVRAFTDEGWPYTLQANIIESDTTLPIRDVAAMIDWSTGTLPEYYDHSQSVNGTLAIARTKVLSPGQHVVRLEARNYDAPVNSVAGVNFSILVYPRIQKAVPARIVFGPILPKDAGFPNNEQWNFNSGSDLEILASSVKMVLITAKGERIMEPDYGTNLRVLLFEQNTEGLQEMAQREIVDAMTRWEPRVELTGLNITKNDDRSITVDCAFESKLTQQTFVVSPTFEP